MLALQVNEISNKVLTAEFDFMAGSAVMCYKLARLRLGLGNLSHSRLMSDGDNYLKSAYSTSYSSLTPRKASFL
jgi:hypothetical protein